MRRKGLIVLLESDPLLATHASRFIERRFGQPKNAFQRRAQGAGGLEINHVVIHEVIEKILEKNLGELFCAGILERQPELSSQADISEGPTPSSQRHPTEQLFRDIVFLDRHEEQRVDPFRTHFLRQDRYSRHHSEPSPRLLG